MRGTRRSWTRGRRPFTRSTAAARRSRARCERRDSLPKPAPPRPPRWRPGRVEPPTSDPGASATRTRARPRPPCSSRRWSVPRDDPTRARRAMSSSTIQSVDRAASILKALAAGSPRLGVSELAERLGLAKATVHGLLRTLERQDLVEQDPETGKYRLGPELLQLGNAFLDHHELRGRSLVWADTLAKRVGEAIRVGVLYGRSVLVVHHVFRPDGSVQILEVGATLPWHASALGKAHAASLSPDRRRSLLSGPLPRLTGRTIVDPHELAMALEEVAAAGFATEDQEAVIGEGEIAAPIFDHGR